MGFWRRKKTQQPQVEAVFRKMAKVAFPGGEDQIALEAAEVASLLRDRISQEEARNILVHAKGRILIAQRTAKEDKEAVQRCIDSILRRWPAALDQTMAEEVAVFAYRRLIVRQVKASSDTTPKTWTGMTKEEALLVSRITAYRLARHRGRNDSDSRQFYDMDPVLYITRVMMDFLTHDFGGRPKKIDTLRDALELSLDVASTLALAHHAEEHGGEATANPKEIDRLAQEELELTLSLARDVDGVAPYAEYDPSEARAASELQVPFHAALRLGEIGLLKDSPDPTESRRKMLSDALRWLQDS